MHYVSTGDDFPASVQELEPAYLPEGTKTGSEWAAEIEPMILVTPGFLSKQPRTIILLG